MKCLNYGIQVLSGWLCLQLRSTQKLLASVYVLFLGLPVFTLRKNLRQCLLGCFSLLFCFLCLGISDVYADPTPTWEPLFVTPTPRPSYSYDCPPGQNPYGWGEVTPNPVWSFRCMKCVTPIPSDSFGENPLGTAVPTIAPTPSWQNPDLNVYFRYWGDVLHEPAPPDTPFTIDTNTSLDFLFFADGNRFYGDHPNAVYKIGFELNSIIDHQNSYNMGLTNRTELTFHCGAEYCRMYDENHSLIYDLGYNQHVHEYLDPNPSGEQTKITKYDVEFQNKLSSDQSFDVSAYTTYDWTWVRTYYQFYWSNFTVWNQPVNPGTYCGQVNGGESGGLTDEQIFSWIPRVGEATCITIGGFGFDFGFLRTLLPYLTIEDPYVPGTQLCFKPIIFGNLMIFGMSIDMDLLAISMMGVTLIRIISRS